MSHYSSIPTQFLELTAHHAPYAAIDPTSSLHCAASGKVIFISGASQGIGQATALAFAQADAKAIYLIARSEKGLLETKALLAKECPDTPCAYSVCDVTNAEQVQAAIEDCSTQFGGIDVADVNAGTSSRWDKKLGDSEVDSWWHTWEVNVKGAYLVVRFALPYLLESARQNKGGYVVVLSSIGAQLVSPGASDYQTSKHALNRLCEFIQAEYAGEGLKCFALHPGGVLTALAASMPQAYQAYFIDAPALPASFMVWLCSGQADWASGRYLSSNWDVEELGQLQEKIVGEDLLVNRLRSIAS